MKLYEINERIRELLDSVTVDPETGEASAEMDELAELTVTLEERLRGLAVYLKELGGEIETFRDERKRIDKIIKSKEAKSDRLSHYLAEQMQQFTNMTGRERFEVPGCRLSYRSSTVPQVEDWDALREWGYDAGVLRVEENEKLDSAALKKYLQNAKERGVNPDGATLVTKKHLQIG